MEDTKIKQDGIQIGKNIRRIRKEKKIKQVELVQMMQLHGVPIYRESLVKIERGAQHITATQLEGFKICLDTTYEELLKR